MARRNDEQYERIIRGLDLRHEFEQLGVRVATNAEPTDDGFLACHAWDRPDNSPSASINLDRGLYKDHARAGERAIRIFDLAVRIGRFIDWQAARDHYANVAGVELSGAARESLQSVAWSDPIVSLWCLQKPPISPESIIRAGGELAYYYGRYTVVSLPVYDGSDAVVGRVMYNTAGIGRLPIFAGRGSAPMAWEKVKVLAGSKPGILGDLSAIAGADEVWWVEGCTDLLAWLSRISQPNCTVLTNSNGCGEHPRDVHLQRLAGKRVYVLGDCDVPGQAGAIIRARAAATVAREVRIVTLPYPIESAHGRDLRDWLVEDPARGYAELVALAGEPITQAERQVEEAADDPDRLARLIRDSRPLVDGCRLQLYWQGAFITWTDGCWVEVSEDDIKSEAHRIIKDEFNRLFHSGDSEKVSKVTRSLVLDVLDAYKSMVSVPGATEPNSWLDVDDRGVVIGGEPQGYLAARNGIVDLDALIEDGPEVLLPPSPKWFSFTRLPYSYLPEATCPTWSQVTAANMEGDEDRVKILQEWAGYLLRPDTSQQKFMLCEGEGQNGKSVYCAGIEALLGAANVSHVPLELFGSRFALTSTLNKLANIAAEIGELDKAAEGHLKAFTSGDRMTFDRKFQSAVEITPTARLTFATNNRPRFSDKSSGLWRRMILVPFRRPVPREERVYGMDKPEWWIESGEMPGVFNWAADGLRRLRAARRFTISEVCESALEEYQEEVNPARMFLAQCCQVLQQGAATCNDVYRNYKEWCEKNSYRPLGERQFGREVRRVFNVERRQQGDSRGGGRQWVYRGLVLIDGLTTTELF